MQENEEGLTIPVYYRNKQWAVTGYGIECLTQRYEIDARALGDSWNKKLPDWPSHMREKSWVQMEAFLPAFIIALTVHCGKFKPQFQKDWYGPTMRHLEREKRRDAEFEAALESSGGYLS